MGKHLLKYLNDTLQIYADTRSYRRRIVSRVQRRIPHWRVQEMEVQLHEGIGGPELCEVLKGPGNDSGAIRSLKTVWNGEGQST